MEIKKNTVASLSYELEVEGAIVDKAGSEKPLEYIHGTGMLLPRFEEEVEGKTEGETFEFTLSAEEGYGEYDETQPSFSHLLAAVPRMSSASKPSSS